MSMNLLVLGTFFLTIFYGDREVIKEYEDMGSKQIMGSGKGAQVEVYCQDVTIYRPPVLCDTIVIWSTDPFDELMLTWSNKPPRYEKLAEYVSRAQERWYIFSSPALTNYVDNLIAAEKDTIPFCLEIKNRNGGLCDIVWWLATKEAGPSTTPRLVYGSDIRLSIGDTWVGELNPDGTPDPIFGREPTMLVCSCTLTCKSGMPPVNERCDGEGPRTVSQLAYVEFLRVPIGIEEGSEKRMDRFILESNPNPFSSVTRISYAVPHSGEMVSLKVYNVTGELVKILVDELQSVGRYEVVWDGKDDRGERLPSGYYFYKLRIGDKELTTKSLLVRL